MAANETHQFVRRRLDADELHIDVQGFGDAKFHRLDVRINLRFLRDDRRIHVHDFSIAQRDDARGFFQKNFARHILPARVGVREKVADVFLANRAQHRVADGVHQRIGVRMAIETFRVRNLHAAENELAPGDQLMNVITNAYVNHASTVKFFYATKKTFSKRINHG